MTEIIDLPKYIGNRIRYYRNEKNLTQEELGSIIGSKKATISNYETGYRTPKQDALFELANALEVKIDDFFPDPHDKSVKIEKPMIVDLIKEIRSLNEEQLLSVCKYVNTLKTKKEE